LIGFHRGSVLGRKTGSSDAAPWEKRSRENLSLPPQRSSNRTPRGLSHPPLGGQLTHGSFPSIGHANDLDPPGFRRQGGSPRTRSAHSIKAYATSLEIFGRHLGGLEIIGAVQAGTCQNNKNRQAGRHISGDSTKKVGLAISGARVDTNALRPGADQNVFPAHRRANGGQPPDWAMRSMPSAAAPAPLSPTRSQPSIIHASGEARSRSRRLSSAR